MRNVPCIVRYFLFLRFYMLNWYYYNIFCIVLLGNILFHLFLSVTFNLIFDYYSRYFVNMYTCIININNFQHTLNDGITVFYEKCYFYITKFI